MRSDVEGSVPELSEERKRQIREEEEAKFRAEQEAELRYRDEVRKQLEREQQEESEQRYREEVRAELGGAPAPAAGAEAQGETKAPSPRVDGWPEKRAARQTRRWPSRLGRLTAGVLLLGGLASVGVAVERGFSVPFLGPPAEIVLAADDSGELVALEESPSGEDGVPSGSGTRTAPPVSSGSARPATAAATPSSSTSGSVRRAVLAGTGISIEVPPGWFVEEGDFDEVLEIRWGGSGRGDDVAYVLLQQSDLRPGEPMEEWAERMVEEVVEAEGSEDEARFERDKVIPDFHGVQALSIDIITPGYMPHHTRNYYWVLRGQGYVLTCYADTGSFEERVPTFDRMVGSIRFSPEGR